MSNIIDSERFLERKAAASRGSGGNDGGCVEDILKRLGVVEGLANETRADVRAIKAVLPHLATNADLNAGLGSLRADMNAGLGSLRSDMNEGLGLLRSDMNALETRIIKWIIGTVITTGALAFSIAKFVG